MFFRKTKQKADPEIVRSKYFPKQIILAKVGESVQAEIITQHEMDTSEDESSVSPDVCPTPVPSAMDNIARTELLHTGPMLQSLIKEFTTNTPSNPKTQQPSR